MKDSSPTTRQQMQDEVSTIESLLNASMTLTAMGSEQGAFNLVEIVRGRAKRLYYSLDTTNA